MQPDAHGHGGHLDQISCVIGVPQIIDANAAQVRLVK